MSLAVPISGALLVALIKGPTPGHSSPGWDIFFTACGFLFSLIFVVVGMLLMLTPFEAMRRARATVFAVTDRRVLTIVGRHAANITTILPDRILKIERHQARNGRGRLRIITGYEKDSDGDTVAKAEEIYGVPRVADAERHILALVHAHRQR